MKKFVKNEEIPVETMAPGLRRQVMGYDTNIMLVRVYFEKGVVASQHQHPHQQASYVEQGRFEVTIDGETRTLEAGDAFVVPSNAMHGVTALSEGILVDTFSPLREDFLSKEPA